MHPSGGEGVPVAWGIGLLKVAAKLTLVKISTMQCNAMQSHACVWLDQLLQVEAQAHASIASPHWSQWRLQLYQRVSHFLTPPARQSPLRASLQALGPAAQCGALSELLAEAIERTTVQPPPLSPTELRWRQRQHVPLHRLLEDAQSLVLRKSPLPSPGPPGPATPGALDPRPARRCSRKCGSRGSSMGPCVEGQCPGSNTPATPKDRDGDGPGGGARATPADRGTPGSQSPELFSSPSVAGEWPRMSSPCRALFGDAACALQSPLRSPPLCDGGEVSLKPERRRKSSSTLRRASDRRSGSARAALDVVDVDEGQGVSDAVDWTEWEDLDCLMMSERPGACVHRLCAMTLCMDCGHFDVCILGKSVERILRPATRTLWRVDIV